MEQKIDRITKLICRISDMNIKHITNEAIFNSHSGKVENSVKKIKTQSKTGVNGYTSIYIGNTFDKISLENINPQVKTNNVYVPPCSVNFGYGDYTNLKIALDAVNEWFKNDDFRNDMYIYSNKGKPISVNSKYKDLYVNFRSHGSNLNNGIMTIYPTVISFNIGVDSYPGIEIRGQTGIIGHCSVTEFYELRMILLDSIKNLYQNSLMLMLLGEYSK